MNKIIIKIIATICCGIIVGSVFHVVQSNNTTFNISTDYPSFKSLKEMVGASNLIVNGVIVGDNGSSLIDAGAGEMSYRTYDLKVTKGVKGKVVKDEIIPIKILETTDDNIDNLLEENTEYICFLETYNNGIPASLINIEQSTILVNNNDIIVSEAQINIIENLDNNVNIVPITNKDKKANRIIASKDELINKIESLIQSNEY